MQTLHPFKRNIQHGVAAIEAALIVLPCMILLGGFLTLAQGLFSIAVTTNDAIYSNLVYNMWPVKSATAETVKQLTVGHTNGVQPSIGINPNDTDAVSFANFVAGEAHRRGDAFGLDPNNSATYAQTSVEVRYVVKASADENIASSFKVNTVVRRFFPLFTDLYVRSSAISFLPRSQAEKLGYIDPKGQAILPKGL